MPAEREDEIPRHARDDGWGNQYSEHVYKAGFAHNPIEPQNLEVNFAHAAPLPLLMK